MTRYKQAAIKAKHFLVSRLRGWGRGGGGGKGLLTPI